MHLAEFHAAILIRLEYNINYVFENIVFLVYEGQQVSNKQILFALQVE